MQEQHTSSLVFGTNSAARTARKGLGDKPAINRDHNNAKRAGGWEGNGKNFSKQAKAPSPREDRFAGFEGKATSVGRSEKKLIFDVSFLVFCYKVFSMSERNSMTSESSKYPIPRNRAKRSLFPVFADLLFLPPLEFRLRVAILRRNA